MRRAQRWRHRSLSRGIRGSRWHRACTAQHCVPPVPRACSVGREGGGGPHLAHGVDHPPVATLHVKRAPRSLYQCRSMLPPPLMPALLAAQQDGILQVLWWPRPKELIARQSRVSFMTITGGVNSSSTP